MDSILTQKILLFSRYPKPGTQNPIVTLRVVDLKDPERIHMRDVQPPQILQNE